VILADLEDLSYKEIADIMECPAGTVMSRLYRGRRMLQKQLADYAAETTPDKAEPGAEVLDLQSYREKKGGAA
jgi:RNA polymerase sigma-70 factor (ECF subfamily)